MSAEPFHLAWFLNGYRVHGWDTPFIGTGAHDWMMPDFYNDFARSLERAGFDYIILEDSAYVPDGYGSSHDFYLRNAMHIPKHDPSVLASVLTQNTSRLGIVTTLNITEYRPYMLARLISTLDHVSKGRAGWNVVTGSSDRAAQNYGFERQPDHDLRYEMAEEYTQLVRQLWDSWEPGSMVVDKEGGVFVDPTKVHAINFEGKFYKCRGPLNTARSPQGQPPIIQAGGSSAGRGYAAKNADSIIATGGTIAELKAYRDDVRARMVGFGRKPDDCKVLFLVSPIIGESEEDAQGKKRRMHEAAVAHPETRLANMGFATNIDFSVYDLDTPLGEFASELKTNGHQSSLDAFIRGNEHRTLRDVAANGYSGQRVELIGTPDAIAAQMEEVMEEVGGDGFLITLDTLTRRSIAEVTDGLVPALQKRGLTRTSYAYDHFRDNLLEF